MQTFYSHVHLIYLIFGKMIKVPTGGMVGRFGKEKGGERRDGVVECRLFAYHEQCQIQHNARNRHTHRLHRKSDGFESDQQLYLLA